MADEATVAGSIESNTQQEPPAVVDTTPPVVAGNEIPADEDITDMLAGEIEESSEVVAPTPTPTPEPATPPTPTPAATLPPTPTPAPAPTTPAPAPAPAPATQQQVAPPDPKSGTPQGQPPVQGQQPAPQPDTQGAPAAPPQTALPKSAEALLQEMGLLPQGFRVPEGQSPQQPPQTPVPTQTPPLPQQQQPQAPAPQQQQQPVDFETVRNQQIELLANNQYALDKETVDALTAEGSSAMTKLAPQLAARVFLDAVQATLMQVSQVLPVMIQQHTVQQEEGKKYENAFYTFWDTRGFDLREHSGDLSSIGMAYRQTNPQGTADKFIQDVGASLIIAKQLAPGTAPAAPVAQPGQQPPLVPAPQGNGQQPPVVGQQPAFQSAAITGVSQPPPQETPFQEWFSTMESADFDE